MNNFPQIFKVNYLKENENSVSFSVLAYIGNIVLRQVWFYKKCHGSWRTQHGTLSINKINDHTEPILWIKEALKAQKVKNICDFMKTKSDLTLAYLKAYCGFKEKLWSIFAPRTVDLHSNWRDTVRFFKKDPSLITNLL